MGRPIKANAEATRQRILDVALSGFADRGVDGVSIRWIAGQASVSLAMVHHYFGSKRDLYEACIDSMYSELARLGPELAVELQGAPSVADAVERSVRAAFQFAISHRGAVRLLLRAVMDAGELNVARRESVQRPFLDRTSAILAAALGRTADEMRLPLQSMVFLISRFAISSEDELALLTPPSDKPALECAEDHLVATARTLLGVTQI
jgi:AcrR family transcriptional regulator